MAFCAWEVLRSSFVELQWQAFGRPSAGRLQPPMQTIDSTCAPTLRSDSIGSHPWLVLRWADGRAVLFRGHAPGRSAHWELL